MARIGQDTPVAAAQDVEALPGQHLEIPGAKHRRQRRLHERLTRLAVAPVEGHVVLQPELPERGHLDPDRGREV